MAKSNTWPKKPHVEALADSKKSASAAKKKEVAEESAKRKEK